MSDTPAALNRKIWLNGQLVPLEQATINVYDHGLLYGDGVFEGIRVYNGRILKLATHLRRLFDSAKCIRLDIPYTADELTQACREALKINDLKDGYIRLCVTRGIGTLGFNPFLCEKPSVFIIADTIELYPKECYEQGMAIITSSVMRNHPSSLSPRIKSLNYLNNILAKIEAIEAGVKEAVMLNHLGYVAECTGDNIFIVRGGGEGGGEGGGKPVLMTPPRNAGALEGVTQGIVIDLAHQAGIKVLHTDLTQHDLYTADEMFLTGTAAELVPVIKVDGRTLGTGKPGRVTQQLRKAFDAFVHDNAPED